MTTDTTMLEAALWYAENSIPVFPVRWPIGDQCSCGDPNCGNNAGKHPLTEHGFLDATLDPAKIARLWGKWPQANIGMPTGKASGFDVLDTDPRNGGPADRAELIERCGPMPETAEDETGGSGRHYFFKSSGGKLPPNIGPGIDLKGDGGYVLLAPSLHKSGRRYQFDGIEGVKALLHPADMPPWLVERIKASSNGNGRAAAGKGKLPEIILDGQKHATCVSLAGSMKRRGCKAAEIFAALVELSKRFQSSVPLENLRAIAEDIEGRYAPEAPPSEVAAHAAGPKPDLLYFEHNDHGNAKRLIVLYGERLRYCYKLKNWLVWDGRRWAVDEGGRAVRLAKETAIEFVTQGMRAGNKDAEKFAKATLDQKRMITMLASAQCELPITPAELDTGAYLLNCLNGTLDLRTGDLLPHTPQHFITKLVHHNYNPAAECPRFLEFLGRIMGGGPDASEGELDRVDRLIAYLQRALGYSLTGTTREKIVFIVHGETGNNGKTTLLSLIYDLLREYAMVLQVDSLMVRQESNNSQADLADLRGARFVMTSETEEGQRLAEGKLKRITQGLGRIKAVRKYENPITFEETHKLWMDCNHKPDVRGVDAAIWNRLALIPFTVTIPDDEIDRDLPGKLLAEAEGILAWAVRGAMRWHAEGLGRPPEISAARDQWRHDSNQVARFVDELCIVLATAQAKASSLYNAYRTWAEANGERAEPEKKFSQRILSLGYTSVHRNTGTVYLGLGFRETRSEK